MNKQKKHRQELAYERYQDMQQRILNAQQTRLNHQAMMKPMVRAIRTMFHNGLPQGWGQRA